MKYAHFINIRVFSKEEDNQEQILNKLKELIPFDFKKEKINLKIEKAFGFDDKKIDVINLKIEKEKHTNKFIENLFNKFNEDQKNLLLKQIESRLDNNLHFYLRLDKDKLLNKEYWLTDSGNCFHFTFAIAAYPHKREFAINILKSILKI